MPPHAIAWLNACVYAVCLPYLGVPVWKSLVVAAVAAICTAMHYGHHWVSRAGVAVLAVTMAIWIGLLPQLETWSDYLKTAKELTGMVSVDSSTGPAADPQTTGSLR